MTGKLVIIGRGIGREEFEQSLMKGLEAMD